jgi:hypothetical protein
VIVKVNVEAVNSADVAISSFSFHKLLQRKFPYLIAESQPRSLSLSLSRARSACYYPSSPRTMSAVRLGALEDRARAPAADKEENNFTYNGTLLPTHTNTHTAHTNTQLCLIFLLFLPSLISFLTSGKRLPRTMRSNRGLSSLARKKINNYYYIGCRSAPQLNSLVQHHPPYINQI